MNRVRNRLICVFLVATLVPLAVTLWISASLLDLSLSLRSNRELGEMAQSLETSGRALYNRSREALRSDVELKRIVPQVYNASKCDACPEVVTEFINSAVNERFELSGEAQDRLLYLVRRGDTISVYSKPIGASMRQLAAQRNEAHELIERAASRDLRKGFRYTFILLAAIVWIISLASLIYFAHRISRPIQELTGGLAQLASGNLAARLKTEGTDEIGSAMRAFNHTAEQLQQSRDRLVYLTRLASWQTLARKMAHEVKNSLTPIRLTMEELVARRGDNDPRFLEQAAQIVVDEVVTLERRVRAFSDFAAEPPMRVTGIDVNSMLEERITFLRTAHPEVIYNTSFASSRPKAKADEDLIKGVLTNLLENAAEAAGPGGVVLAKSGTVDGKVSMEVHDSGPGLSLHAKGSLFEPTISFKKAGMGLGLSIAKRSAMLSGGDLQLINSDLGGAAFRVVLPVSEPAEPAKAPETESVHAS